MKIMIVSIMLIGFCALVYSIGNNKKVDNKPIISSSKQYKEYTMQNGFIVTERPVTEEEHIGTIGGGGGGGKIPSNCKTIWQSYDPKNPLSGGPGGCY